MTPMSLATALAHVTLFYSPPLIELLHRRGWHLDLARVCRWPTGVISIKSKFSTFNLSLPATHRPPSRKGSSPSRMARVGSSLASPRPRRGRNQSEPPGIEKEPDSVELYYITHILKHYILIHVYIWVIHRKYRKYVYYAYMYHTI